MWYGVAIIMCKATAARIEAMAYQRNQPLGNQWRRNRRDVANGNVMAYLSTTAAVINVNVKTGLNITR